MNFKPIPNKFEYLNWQEIESIAKDKRSTVIWPFGAVEQHGPHLPLATDSIFVDEIINEVFKLLSTDIPLKKKEFCEKRKKLHIHLVNKDPVSILSIGDKSKTKKAHTKKKKSSKLLKGKRRTIKKNHSVLNFI